MADTRVNTLSEGYQNRALYGLVSVIDELGILDNPIKFFILNVLLMANEMIYRATYDNEDYDKTITLNLLLMISSIFLVNIGAQIDNAINDSVPMLIDRSAIKRELYAGIYTNLFPVTSRLPGDSNLKFTLVENTNKIFVLALMMEWNRVFLSIESGLPFVPAMALEAYIKTFTVLAINFASQMDNTFCELEPALSGRALQRRQINKQLFCRFFSEGRPELYPSPDTRNMTLDELESLSKDATKKIRSEVVKHFQNMLRM